MVRRKNRPLFEVAVFTAGSAKSDLEGRGDLARPAGKIVVEKFHRDGDAVENLRAGCASKDFSAASGSVIGSRQND